MSKQRLSGWRPREESWEEAVLSWYEQVDRGFLRRRVQQERTGPLARLRPRPPEHEALGAARKPEDQQLAFPDQ